MCGIFGEIRWEGDASNHALYHKALGAIAHRGPDHRQLYHYEHATLAHARLSIIDLDPRAHQPLFSPDKRYAIVFNGTIYNYQALTKELNHKGFTFTTTSDTEAILHGYRHYGPAIVSKLDGIFAFAIYDQHHHQLFLARDRFGIKPLYIQSTNKQLRFASTTDALLAFTDNSPTLNPTALHHQFTFHGSVPAPHTVIQGIDKFPPAEHWHISSQHTTKTKYWSLNPTPTTLTEQEHTEQIESLLKDAIKKQSSANDVPVGILLSGGLDSSLLTALYQKPHATYSIGFESSHLEEGNEFYYSDLVAKHIGSKHHTFTIPTTTLIDRLEELITAMSEPIFAQDAIGFYLLSREVAKDYKVVLSGQGADEVFAGYSWYHHFYQQPTIDSFNTHYLDRSHQELTNTITIAPPQDPSRALLAKHITATDPETFFSQALTFDITSFMIDDPVKRVDTMTMAHGLEARVPFLDHFLVEAAANIPAKHKLARKGQGGAQKHSR